MIPLKSVEGLLYLSVVTKYDIAKIYDAVNSFGNASEYLEKQLSESPNTSAQIIKHNEESLVQALIMQDKLRYHKIDAIPFFSLDYPQQLRQFKNMPPILYVKGKLLNKKLTAVVGTRSISQVAYQRVIQVTDELIDNDYGVVSGLAYGIDTMAHQRVIQRHGYTISVLPTSLDHIYPRENYKLAADILENDGALISEMPLSFNRGNKSFIERNRIQSALSDAVIPVEFNLNSGTMHTVNFTISQGKYLIVITPPNEISTWKQYEGIVHLREKYKNGENKRVIIVESKREYREVLRIIKENSMEDVPKQTTLFTE